MSVILSWMSVGNLFISVCCPSLCSSLCPPLCCLVGVRRLVCETVGGGQGLTAGAMARRARNVVLDAVRSDKTDLLKQVV